jgi:predicted transcriptional regulator
MKAFKDFEIWWVTGAQLLYGGDTVKIVDKHSQEMVDGLNEKGIIPIKIIYKGTANSEKEVTTIMMAANNDKKCVGIITDGDLRRAIERYGDLTVTAEKIMSHSFKRITKEALLTDALAIMDQYNITTLAVTETPESDDIIGILSIHHIIDFN